MNKGDFKRRDPTWMHTKAADFSASDWVWFVPIHNQGSPHVSVRSEDKRTGPLWKNKPVHGTEFQISRQIVDAIGWRPGMRLEFAMSPSLNIYRFRPHQTAGAGKVTLSINSRRKGRVNIWIGPSVSGDFKAPECRELRHPEFRMSGQSLFILWGEADDPYATFAGYPPFSPPRDWVTALAKRPAPGTAILRVYRYASTGGRQDAMLSLGRDLLQQAGWVIPCRVRSGLSIGLVIALEPAESGLLVRPLSRTVNSGEVSMSGILRGLDLLGLETGPHPCEATVVGNTILVDLSGIRQDGKA